MNAYEEFAALLDPYVDGELSAEDAARVRAHLEHCGGCRSYVDAALAIRAAFPTAEDTAVPDGFAEHVLAAIRAEAAPPSKKARRTPWAKVLVPLAACFALVILVQRLPWNEAPAEPRTADTAAAQADAAPRAFSAAPAGGRESGTTEESAPAELEKTAPTEADGTAPPQQFYVAEDAAAPTGDPVGGARAVQEPEAPGLAPMDAGGAGAPEALSGENAPSDADAWVEDGNVVFAATVYLTPDYVGGALDGYEGRPYSNANRPEEGVIGTGYALEPEDFDRILTELGCPMEPMLRQERTTELNCIVVTEADYAYGGE